ncbi:MAG: hypothetical protein R6U04_01330 [Bacteroidales bacterium]
MKKVGLWILAIILTLTAAIYQRKTGPTYPKDTDIEINNKKYSVTLPRSHVSTEDCEISLDVPPPVTGRIYYKRYPTNKEWQREELETEDNQLKGYLPAQPPAGKLEYYLELKHNQTIIHIAQNEPVIIRFKGEVPDAILVPHVIFMFLAMMFSTLAGLFALGKFSDYKLYGYITIGLLIIGGFVFGPIMQYFAFGDFWTGIPFGWDLTDNKTLIAFVGWLTAILSNQKKNKPKYYIFAALLLLLIFSIPHSLMGSELNYETGEIKTGMILGF